MRRLSSLLVLTLLVSMFVLPTGPSAVYAATFRTFVAQVPTQPGTGSVRVWMNSDTALGETAGIEYYLPASNSYVKVLGTYDTSYSGANWRADIPGQSAGTEVRYQLFTRNQSGGDYGFSGFNWSYTTSGQACAGAALDNDVRYNGLFHDSFSTDYRNPTGPAATSQGSVTLKLRTCANDVSDVTLRVWDDRTNQEALYQMQAGASVNDATLGPVQYWSYTLSVGSNPTILYYTFRATDGGATGYYRDDDPKFYGGGYGQAESNRTVAEDNSYQLTVYDPAFFTPDWMQRGIIYQIFPDRFRDGDSSNNPQAGRFSYGAPTAIVRSNDPAGNWNTTVCDPRGSGACAGHYGDNFYGGDLKGVTQKIQDGYFSSLGVTLLYLNPIFRAPSNHKYDTANFLEIDPDFGTLADFQALVAAANARGIRVMLDGVFNHTSSDSPYFDRYHRYNAANQLVNPNGGASDGSGACEAVSSPYRSWYYFPATGNAGKDGSTVVYCADASGNPTVSYEAWYGYSSLPKLQANSPQVRNLIWANGLNSVGPYWTQQGASGWRFDVGADVDPGLTNDPSNDYWEGFRAAVRNQSVTGKNDTVMLGEEWGDATPWLLGNEWDSVMNYRFRSTVLSWMFTGCSGNGCTNGTVFQENDSNYNSSSGAISAVTPSQFNARLRSIAEDYPKNAFKAMMNLAGSHDTQRVRFLLKKINNNSDAAAVQRMKEWWLFAYTYAGNPTLYYGDEIGLTQDGVWDGSQYQDDPYNRTPFPWPDASGSDYTADTTNLLPFARQLASLRLSSRALQDGDVQHGMVIDDAKGLYGFGRTTGTETALVLLNRSSSTQSAAFSGLNAAPYNLADGTVLRDAISGTSYTVSGGAVTVSVTPTWGAVLIDTSKQNTPAAATVSVSASGSDVTLSWPIVGTDSASGPEVITSYEVYRGTSASFTPDSSTLVTTLTPPSFGGDLSYTDANAVDGGYYYIVRSCNAAGKCADSTASAPAKQNTSLMVDPVNGTYGGDVTLSATLTRSNAPLAGRSVTFTLNGTVVGSTTTDAQGVATLTVSLGAINAGTYPTGVGASFAGDGAYNPSNNTAALTVAKATATLTLNNLSHTYDGTAKAATVTTDPTNLSGVTITYDGGNDAPVNAGSYAVVAALNNPNYTAAAVNGTLTIAKASATITLSDLSQTYDGTQKVVGITTNPAGLSGLTVSYNGSSTQPTNAGSYAVVVTLDNPNYTGSASDTLVITKASATLTLTNLTQSYNGTGKSVTVTSDPADLTGISVTYEGGATLPVNVGSYAVVATLDNPNYSAPSAAGTLTIIQANQTINFAPLADKTYGDAPFTVSATASSGLAVSFSATGNCTVSSNTVTITGAGSCTITASQGGGGNYSAAAPVDQTFTIAKAAATLSLGGLNQTYNGTAKTATVTTNPAALSGVTITYNGTNVAPIAAGSYAVVASLDNPNYTAVDTTGTLVIAKATATLSLSGLNQTYNGTPRAVTVTTSPAGLSGVTVTYNGSATAPTAAGSYAVVASLDNPNYTATDKTGTLVIAKANQTISLSGVPSSTTVGSSFTVTASASSGLSVSLSVSGPCTLSGKTVTVTATGTCTVTANQAGNTNYNAAPSVKASTTITSPAKASITPVTTCVVRNHNGTYTARFGYQSKNKVAVTIPVGANNYFSPAPTNRGQTTVFQPGTVQVAFSVTWNGSKLTWSLKGPDGKVRTTTATSKSTVCR